MMPICPGPGQWRGWRDDIIPGVRVRVSIEITRCRGLLPGPGYSAHGESELKKLVLGVHCIVWGPERAEPYVSQPGPSGWCWSLVSVVWSSLVTRAGHMRLVLVRCVK